MCFLTLIYMRQIFDQDAQFFSAIKTFFEKNITLFFETVERTHKQISTFFHISFEYGFYSQDVLAFVVLYPIEILELFKSNWVYN